MKRESGFTLVELLVVVMVISILSAITIMSLIRSRAAANEASAISSVRTISSAQMTYAASCGRGFFASDLQTLGVPPPGAIGAYSATELTVAPVIQKSGYQVQVATGAAGVAGVADCNGTATVTAYYASAVPLSFGMSGARSFAMTSTSNAIWMSYAATAPAEPFGAPSLPLQ